MHWLIKPSVAGTETVAGADTTHIRAGINVPALLADISTFLTQGLVARRFGRCQPAEGHLAGDAGQDRKPGEEPRVRRLDRQRRQDRPQAVDRS